MTTLRTVTLPISHLAAELCAAPFGTEAAFRGASTTLAVHTPGGDPLWRDTERQLVQAFPGLSLDHLVSMRDLIWFGTPSEVSDRRGPPWPPVPLHGLLRRIAKGYLDPRGPRARPRLPPWGTAGDRVDREDGDDAARRSFRWLTFALPTDVLLAALNKGEPGPHRIERVTPILARQLADRQFAELHLHFNAGLTFPILWVALLHRLARHDFKARALASAGACFDEGRSLAPVMLQAAVARHVLGCHLESGSPALHLDALPDLGTDRPHRALLYSALDLFVQGIPLDPGDFAELQEIYAEMTGVRALHLGDRAEDIPFADPLRRLLRPADVPGRFPESYLTARGLQHLENGDPGRRDDFASLFWQMIRARCLFYRHIVQRPMTPGLTWFVRHYRRFGDVIDGLSDMLRMRVAIETSGGGRGLKAIELRCGPPKNLAEGRKFVDTLFRLVAEGWRPAETAGPADEDAGTPALDHGSIEIGAVVHFARDRGGGALQGWPAAFELEGHANPAVRGYRYGAHYLSHRRQAVALASLLRNHPASLYALRGVDVCTDELGVPTWVMRPLFRHVRDAAAMAATAIERATGHLVRAFGATAHAGEDFVHLLGGLRRIHEAIEHFGLGRGDRLGHAVALGVDPARWATGAGTVAISVEERLFDLTWEWSSYRRWSGSVPGDRVRYIGDKIGALAERMFGTQCAPFEAERLVSRLHEPAWLKLAGFPGGVPTGAPGAAPAPDGAATPPSPKVQEMLIRYLTDARVFQRGQEIEAVEPERDRAVLSWLHDRLRDEVASRGIVVEVNPSSNLLIGNLGDLEQHPMWRLNPPRPIAGLRPVALCIGSDDPVVFATTLLEEYQILADVLTRGGVSDDEARGWLNKVRRTGLDTRFTLDPRQWPRSLDDIPSVPHEIAGALESPP